MRFTGRTALVTGAGHGLGTEIARALADHGADLVLVGRNTHALESAAKRVGESGSVTRIELCDVSDPNAVSALSSALHGEFISILINNAGIAGPVKALVDIESTEWDDVFATNVRGVYLMCRAFLPEMLQRGHGDVINIASVSGKRPLPMRTPYSASKMAVIGLTLTLAAEVGSRGVNVNCLSPGYVRGARMERVIQLAANQSGKSFAEVEREYLARTALGRMLEESEVAQAVIAMLSMPGLTAADIDLSAGMVGR